MSDASAYDAIARIYDAWSVSVTEDVGFYVEEALAAAYELLLPDGLFVFDVFAPSRADIDATNGRWLEREPGIWERAEWDEGERTLTLTVRGETGETTMQLAWLSELEWRDLILRSGFEIVACYGWFDRSVYRGGEDVIWIARKELDRVPA